MLLREEVFEDRRDAGRILGRIIQGSGLIHDGDDAIILGLPRGGVPVAYEVALVLDLPLDIVVVRKLGVPGFGELAMGAIASDGAVTLNPEIIRELRIPEEVIDAAVEREKQELERRDRAYRNGLSPRQIEGRVVVLVDDGLATGASMLAAIRAVRPRAGKVIVAVPVAANSTCKELREDVDEIICARVPSPFYSVGSFYRNFDQTSDAEVSALLSKARDRCKQMTA